MAHMSTSTTDSPNTSKETGLASTAPRRAPLVRPEVLEWIRQLAQRSMELSKDEERLRELKKRLF
jgi:hypothetical protein